MHKQQQMTDAEKWLSKQIEQSLIDSHNINATIYNTNKTAQFDHTKSIYKRFQIPPDIQLCELHQRATAFGTNKQDDVTKCPCCNQRVKQHLSCNVSNSQIYKINEPVGYYFTFIKMMLIALLFMIVFPAQDCQNDQNDCDYIYGVPVPRIQAFYTEVSLFLNALIIVVLYIVIAFLYYWNAFIHEKMRFCHKKASDEHVFLTGLDHDKIQQSQLKEQFQGFQVQEIIYTYKIQNYLGLLNKKHKIQAFKRKYQKQGKMNKVNKLNAKLRKIDNQIIPIKNQFQIGNDKFMRTDKVFIKFLNADEKAKFESVYKTGFMKMICNIVCRRSDLIVNDCNLYVQRLGDPRQIVWQNLQISSNKRMFHIFINWIISILILVISFYVVLQLNQSQKKYQENADIILSIAMSIIIELVNMLLGFIINFTTKFQRRYTLTGESSIKLFKKTIFYFCNTTIIPFSMFLFHIFTPDQNNLAQNILTIFIICNIISPVAGQYISATFFTKIYKRYRVKCLYTQIKANDIFQKSDFNLQDRYGLLCQRMTNCMFFAAIFPIGAIITAIGLIITFVVSKNQLIHFCSIPRHSFRLGKLINSIAAFFPCIYGFGYVANLYLYQQSPAYNPIYSIVLAGFTLPITFVFVIFGNRIARRYIDYHIIEEQSKLVVSQEVTYKDLNPTSFFYGTGGTISAKSTVRMLLNLNKYSLFRSGIHFSRMSKSTISSGMKQIEEEEDNI